MVTSAYEQFGSDYKDPSTASYQGDEANLFGSQHPPARPAAPRPTAPATASDAGAGQVPYTASPAQPQTFAQMQTAGFARPPMPALPPDAALGGDAPRSPYQDQSGGGYQPLPNPGGPPSGYNLGNELYSAYSGYEGPQSFRGSPFTGSYSPYSGPASYLTGGFSAPNSPVTGATQGSVMSALSNPSPYLSDAVQGQYNKLTQNIDDDFNNRDARLQADMAHRGLGDSTISANDQRYQNILRRTAKEDVGTNLLSGMANTYGADRMAAINAAMGYGGQQFGQALQGFGANMGANAQNFGQGLSQSEFGAGQAQSAYDRALQAHEYNTGLGQQGFENELQSGGLGFQEKQQLLNNLLGYGQQSFQNQYATSQMNNQQQQQQLQMLMQLLGYGQ